MQRSWQVGVVIAVMLLAVSPAFGATWYAKPTPTGTGNCSSWANACTLPQAVAAATGTQSNPGHVWARKGTYQLSEAIRLKNYVKIIGGFNGNETQAAQSKPFVNLTILHGGGGTDPEECDQAPLPIVYSKGNNRYAELRGFVLKNGDAPGLDYLWCGGGAMLMIDSGATISHCIFRDNFAWVGGAVAVYGPRLFPYPTFTHCIFHGNGKYQIGTDPVTQAPIYQDNFSGGAVALWLSAAYFNHCLFYDNWSFEGGAIWMHPDATTHSILRHCTLTANRARDSGGGINAGQSYRMGILNSIVRGNVPNNVRGPQVGMAFSNIFREDYLPHYHEPNNIDADPMFINSAAHDYRIRFDSPCRNTADNQYLNYDNADVDLDGITGEPTPFDLALKARQVEGIVDMGAYEVSCAAPPVVDCNANSVPDACDIADGDAPDCNNNAVPDSCDLTADATLDCHNENGIPDSCEAVPKGACCLPPPSLCQGQQTVCRCAALGGTWQTGTCAMACGGGGEQ